MYTISGKHLPGSQEVQTLESTLKKLGNCAFKLQQKSVARDVCKKWS